MNAPARSSQHQTADKRMKDLHGRVVPDGPTELLLDLETSGMEVHVTPDHVLILVDRSPIIADDDCNAFLRSGVHGLAGSHLTLVGELESVDDVTLHGVYSGLLGGSAVIMDQYIRLRNGVPVAIARVIARVNGGVANTEPQEAALSMLGNWAP